MKEANEMGVLKEGGGQRAIRLGNLVVDSGAVLEVLEDYTGIPKSTIYYALTKILPKVDADLAKKARVVFLRHKRKIFPVTSKVFRLEIIIGREKCTTYATGHTIEMATKKIKKIGATIRRDGPILECAVCDNLWVNSCEDFFCGHAIEMTKCPLSKNEYCPGYGKSC